MNNSLEISETVKEIINNTGAKQYNILAILHEIQKKYNYLPEAALKTIYLETDISPRIIVSVATFYNNFRFKPAGSHIIKVCIGTACHVKGALQLYNNFKEYLKISSFDDTDKDGLFTVEKVACLGCCMIAPAVMIDDITYGFVNKKKIPLIIRDFLASQKNNSLKYIEETTPEKVEGVIKICLCSSCKATGAKDIYNQLLKVIKNSSLKVQVKSVSCKGISFEAPFIEIEMQDNFKHYYGRVGKQNVKKILYHHFRPKKLKPYLKEKLNSLLEKIYFKGKEDQVIRYLIPEKDATFSSYVNLQEMIATSSGGDISPLSIDEYENNGGFQAFKDISTLKSHDNIIEIIKKSGLRGRGGGGFNTSQKWFNVKKNQEKEKFLICNADEGDPGAFMDRMLLESFPFKIIEGILIAALTCGINKGFMFIRSEYTLAIERFKEALNICVKKGYLTALNDNNIFHLEIIVSAGSFVCGEETAMIASIEGKRGFPSFRPPYPTEKGLWGKPTLVNNVETFSLIPWIITNGDNAFKRYGTSTSPGTKTFALAGKIRNGGLIEIEMGTSLRDIIYKIGGGIPDDKKLKAVQIGGPAGGCISAENIDTQVDYENLHKLGAIMGSGGLVVLDEDDCIVDIVKYFLKFSVDESCGKCTFCRVGTKRLYEMLEDLTKGKADKNFLVKIKELALHVKHNSLCGLGKSAPNPLLSSLAFFEDEFKAHIQGICPAGKCKDLITYEINDDCTGCTKCIQQCPSGAIQGTPYSKHVIDKSLCVKCDSCYQVCSFGAIERTPAGKKAK